MRQGGKRKITVTISFPPYRKGRVSVKASEAVDGSPEAMPLAAGFGDGSGVPNDAKPPEPFSIQPCARGQCRLILFRVRG